MLAGPVFTREVITIPRRARLYLFRAAYVGTLLILLATAWQVLAGTQLVRNTGDLARFGAMAFQILAPLQLTVAIFFAALSAASSVALEKDRRTLILLLLTQLTNAELVVGKMLASILGVMSLVVAALPLFMLLALLGGISFGQVASVFGVTIASTFAAGSLGSTIAFWRERTFQTLAMTTLAIVFWTVAWEAVARGAFGTQLGALHCDALAAGFSPWHAVLEATRPLAVPDPALGSLQSPVNLFLIVAVGATLGLNLLTISLVRVWNPSREERRHDAPERERFRSSEEIPHVARHWHLHRDEESESSPEAPPATAPARRLPTRRVWDNPIVWREVCTWAYGRKVLLIRFAYLLLFVLAALGVRWMLVQSTTLINSELAMPIIPLLVASLVLINAQAVTSLTSERDSRALDVLLVTDLTPREFVFGKLLGVLFNTKEMIVLPLLLCGYLWWQHALHSDDFVYLIFGWLVMVGFVAVLGLHCGMNYANSRTAIAVSLGTVFFLFVGVATSMRIMVAFSGSFEAQLQPFLASMVGGGIGLYAALGYRNPSPAIAVASVLLPIATFYSLTAFMLGSTLAVFLVVSATYGFTIAAMLIPAIYEFDVATGRTVEGGE